MRLDKKVALITGGTSGIGRATAALFARERAKVTLVGRSSSRGKEAVKMIEQNGGVAQFISADVSIASDIERAVRTTVDMYGSLDILFNNAAISSRSVPIENTDEKDWDTILDVNLKGVFLGCKYAVPIMKKQGGGVIINTSSTGGVVGGPLRSAYCASKAGMISTTTLSIKSR